MPRDEKAAVERRRQKRQANREADVVIGTAGINPRKNIDPKAALDRFSHELLAQMTTLLRRLEWNNKTKQLTPRAFEQLKVVRELMTYGREYIALSVGATPGKPPGDEKPRKPPSAGDSAAAIAAMRDGLPKPNGKPGRP